MDIATSDLILAVTGGFVAGWINTLAGNGSIVTLSLLTDLFGLPGNLANGTNRVGILFQSFTTSWGFYRKGKIDLWKSREMIIIIFLGAIVGVYLAISVSNEQFMQVFKYLIVVMLGVILVNPKRWLRDVTAVRKLPLLVRWPIFFLLGFYGGFIQMGMGVLFLIVAVLIMHYEIIEANALKSVIIMLYTLVVILIFQWKGLIQWEYGLIVAAGQSLGGYLAAIFAADTPWAGRLAYYLLIAMVVIVIIRLYFF